MADPTTDFAPLDPDHLDGFDVHNGISVCDIGEDGDTLLMGHHEPDAAWAAFASRQVYMGNWATLDDEPREHYTMRQGLASFSQHSEGCHDQAKEVCASCATDDHDACMTPCLCEDEYDHDDEGPSATPVPCSCEDEYAWWVSETKDGAPVTWVNYDWKAARERHYPPVSTTEDGSR